MAAKRPRVDLDADTLTAVARALARENLRRADRGLAPLSMPEFARGMLMRDAHRQLAEESAA